MKRKAEPQVGKSAFYVGDFAVFPTRNLIMLKERKFRLEPKVIEVLCALADRPGEVLSNETLLDRVWQDSDVSEDSLFRAISLLRKVFKNAEHGGTYLETVPRRGYRLRVKVTSPARPASTDGATSDAAKDVQRSASWFQFDAKSPVNLRLAFMVSAVLAVLVLVSSMWWRRPETAADTERVTRNQVQMDAFQSIGAESRPLSDSLHATFIAYLSQYGIATISAQTGNSAQDIMSEFSLGGQVRFDENIYTVALSLAETATGVSLWSASEQFNSDEIQYSPRKIAADVTRILSCAVDLRGRKFDQGSATLRKYLQFCDAYITADARHALPRYSRELLDLQPNDPTAKALHALSLAATTPRIGSFTREQRESRLEYARNLAEQVLSREPDHQLALTAMALSFDHQTHWSSANQYLSRAVENRSYNSMAFYLYAVALWQTGQIENAVKAFDEIVEMDPLNIVARERLSWLLLFLQFPEADRHFAIIDDIDPENDYSRIRRLQAEIYFGDPDKAQAALENRMTHPQLAPAVYRCYAAFLQMRRTNKLDLDEFDASCGDQIVPAGIRLQMFTILGDLDRAFQELVEVDPSDPGSTIVFFYPHMNAFRNDSRFWPVAKRFGLIDYWLDTDQWPDFCSRQQDLPYDCREAAMAARKSIQQPAPASPL